jgi:hypothetical protein
MDKLEKLARKRSQDSEQEKLRQAKDEWNKEVSSVISKLIGFKKGINGRGDKTLGISPVSIKDPFPSQMASALSDLASSYSKIIDHAKKIMDQQHYYSEHRNKPKNASEEYNLVSEALWPFDKIKNFWKKDSDEQKLKKEIFESLEVFIKDLSELRESISSLKDKSNILGLIQNFAKVIYIKKALVEPAVIDYLKLTVNHNQTQNQNHSENHNQNTDINPELKGELLNDFNKIYKEKEFIKFILNHISGLSKSVLNDKDKLDASDKGKLLLNDIEQNFHLLKKEKLSQDDKIKIEEIKKDHYAFLKKLRIIYNDFNDDLNHLVQILNVRASSQIYELYKEAGILSNIWNYFSKSDNSDLLKERSIKKINNIIKEINDILKSKEDISKNIIKLLNKINFSLSQDLDNIKFLSKIYSEGDASLNRDINNKINSLKSELQ